VGAVAAPPPTSAPVLAEVAAGGGHGRGRGRRDRPLGRSGGDSVGGADGGVGGAATGEQASGSRSLLPKTLLMEALKVAYLCVGLKGLLVEAEAKLTQAARSVFEAYSGDVGAFLDDKDVICQQLRDAGEEALLVKVGKIDFAARKRQLYKMNHSRATAAFCRLGQAAFGKKVFSGLLIKRRAASAAARKAAAPAPEPASAAAAAAAAASGRKHKLDNVASSAAGTESAETRAAKRAARLAARTGGGSGGAADALEQPVAHPSAASQAAAAARAAALAASASAAAAAPRIASTRLDHGEERVAMGVLSGFRARAEVFEAPAAGVAAGLPADYNAYRVGDTLSLLVRVSLGRFLKAEVVSGDESGASGGGYGTSLSVYVVRAPSPGSATATLSSLTQSQTRLELLPRVTLAAGQCVVVSGTTLLRVEVESSAGAVGGGAGAGAGAGAGDEGESGSVLLHLVCRYGEGGALRLGEGIVGAGVGWVF
jgi:hypothetical protein